MFKSTKFTTGLTNMSTLIPLTDTIVTRIPSNTTWLHHRLYVDQRKGSRENDENADSDDDNDGYCDIHNVF